MTKAEIQALEQRTLLRFAELEHCLTVRFASVMVVLIGLLFAPLDRVCREELAAASGSSDRGL